jgi:uncharacterized protein VirK/YbjX
LITLAKDKPLAVALWLVTTWVLIHLIFCYLFTGFYWIRSFMFPRDNRLLEREHSLFPQLREFVFRPYVNRYWSMSTRLRVISSHYRLVDQCVPLFAIAVGEGMDLLEIALSGQRLRINIDRPLWMRREGEIAVSLFYGIDRIYSAMILLAGTPDDMKMIVGNVQGDGRDRADLYRSLTKSLHGMRPRDFLMHMLKILAQEIGCQEILGVSDAAHRSSNVLSRAKKLAVYNEIWREHGGIEDESIGFFRLPARLSKRTDEEIPKRKRALYRHRYELLDELRGRIRREVLKSGRVSTRHTNEEQPKARA